VARDNTKRAVVYTRISRDPKNDSVSPQRQEALCRAMAEAQGWEVVEVLTDRGASAWQRDSKRPGWDRVLGMVARREVDVVMAYSLARLGRRTRDLLDLSDYLRANECALAVVDQNLDTSTPAGQLFYNMVASFAQMESEQTSERVKSATKLAAQQGRFHSGGHRQFGYNRRRADGSVEPDPTAEPGSVNETEAAVVRELSTRMLAGESVRQLAIELNSRGVTTTTGREWAPHTLSQMMRSSLLAGLREHRVKVQGQPRVKRGELYEGTWEPILERETWSDLRAELDGRRVSGLPSVKAHLLTGLMKCGRCGHNMRGHESRVEGRKAMVVYHCQKRVGESSGACGGMSVAKASAERFIVGSFLDFVSQVRLRQEDGSAVAETEQALVEAERRLSKLARDYYTEGVAMSEDLFNETLGELTAVVDRLRTARDVQRAAEAARAGALPPGDRDALQAWWDQAGLVERREALKRAIDRVVVSPARRGGNQFDTGRLHIAWTFDVYVAGAVAGEFPEGVGRATDEFLNEYEVELLPPV
jgi:DNA invertase Pin-like site-specific DNA recombinase